MTLSLGIDTGGTYTDAVLHDENRGVVAKAKALTTRHDLAIGIGAAMDEVLAQGGLDAGAIGLVSISTTLATNALVEGQGGRIALVMIGFGESDLDKAGLRAALGGDPVIFLPGGHDAHGRAAALNLSALEARLDGLANDVSAFAIAGYFAVRNPEHEVAVRDLIRARAGLPVTASHELSAKLDGPRRALTTVLNARLISMIDRLIDAAENRMSGMGIAAPLMVVRGDGSLVSASFARLRPIETILSGPAASIVGARHLAGENNAIVADIGGTTTDIAILEGGLPRIDPQGATVGGYRTMVDAVAMRTFGLGGDSEVSLQPGVLIPEIKLGPRRVVPLSLMADLDVSVIAELQRQSRVSIPARNEGRFAMRAGIPDRLAAGLSRSEADLFSRIDERARPLDTVLTSNAELATLDRLAARGLVLLAGITPSDAQHVTGRFTHWNREAAVLGATLFARRRDGYGNSIATDPEAISRRVIDRLVRLSAERVLETALSEDGLDGAALSLSPLARRAIDRPDGIAQLMLSFDRPLIGLGAGASAYYPPAGDLLNATTVIPDHADVANAIGAVVGQVRISVTADVAEREEGVFEITGAMLDGRAGKIFPSADQAMTAAGEACRAAATEQAALAGAGEVQVTLKRDIRSATIEDRSRFISATVTATASGRPATAP
ncbi:hydantoinase/oxoprolinase N-terminal domain-containing protein [Oricola cellulosilytica]|uniref:Hydantoinase/oxoprolinase family protein n=1 Tax=Oricola cellulosilytica TaxID=1429082 RepID=A0A4R0PKN3_9HYPH|nr:hydantoinase/oxoprolinase family protein [Oricola cellulosilytica]TCD16119.1 hydantoinase/oxoprolinase family protein [Oricola cellulosilytica]